MIRFATSNDVGQIAELHARVWGTEGFPRARSVAAFQQHFRKVYFENPWYDERLSSLVFEDAEGRIVGMLGIVNRPMVCAGRPVRVAVSSELAVDPRSRSQMAGVQLLKKYLDGPQDLCVADSANENSRKIWNRLGGSVAPLASLHWLRPLRLCRYVVTLLRRRRTLSPLALMASPFARLADGVASRLRSPLHPEQSTLRSCLLTPELFQQHLPALMQKAVLRPETDASAANWIWGRLEHIASSGRMHTTAVTNEQGEVAGWHIYQIKRSGVAEVLHVAANERSTGEVLKHLFHHAWRQGAVVVRGRLHPPFLQALSDQRCIFHRQGGCTLVHSREPELLRCFEQDTVFFSPLDGESSLSFHPLSMTRIDSPGPGDGV